ncbi:MAG: response regulator transcription factor [Gammaproteobacteria bacterium]
MRLLVIEDDGDLLEEIKQGLQQSGFAVDISRDGREGEFLAETEDYDAVVLDLGLPGKGGLAVLSVWRERGNDVPVLILTARGAWHEKVEGFRAGADDYLAKPFHMEELAVRLQALIRRRYGRSDPVLRVGDVTLDPERQCVTVADGNPVDLTATEYRLLEYLMQHAGKIASKTRLLEHTYSNEAEADENLIEVYINRLRGKLGSSRIETRRGQGYVFVEAVCDP